MYFRFLKDAKDMPYRWRSTLVEIEIQDFQIPVGTEPKDKEEEWLSPGPYWELQVSELVRTKPRELGYRHLGPWIGCRDQMSMIIIAMILVKKYAKCDPALPRNLLAGPLKELAKSMGWEGKDPGIVVGRFSVTADA